MKLTLDKDDPMTLEDLRQQLETERNHLNLLLVESAHDPAKRPELLAERDRLTEQLAKLQDDQ